MKTLEATSKKNFAERLAKTVRESVAAKASFEDKLAAIRYLWTVDVANYCHVVRGSSEPRFQPTYEGRAFKVDIEIYQYKFKLIKGIRTYSIMTRIGIERILRSMFAEGQIQELVRVIVSGDTLTRDALRKLMHTSFGVGGDSGITSSVISSDDPTLLWKIIMLPVTIGPSYIQVLQPDRLPPQYSSNPRDLLMLVTILEETGLKVPISDFEVDVTDRDEMLSSDDDPPYTIFPRRGSYILNKNEILEVTVYNSIIGSPVYLSASKFREFSEGIRPEDSAFTTKVLIALTTASVDEAVIQPYRNMVDRIMRLLDLTPEEIICDLPRGLVSSDFLHAVLNEISCEFLFRMRDLGVQLVDKHAMVIPLPDKMILSELTRRFRSNSVFDESLRSFYSRISAASPQDAVDFLRMVYTTTEGLRDVETSDD